MSLDAEDLLSFSYQVAKGMEYITSKNVRLLKTVLIFIEQLHKRFNHAAASLLITFWLRANMPYNVSS